MRPLRLKAEVFKKPETDFAVEKSVARVWVDSGVYHLDQAFDYAIPQILSSVVSIGVRVEVPFNGRACEGLVIDRVDQPHASLKSINKVISSFPVATTNTIELIGAVAKRWAAHPYDIIRSAIPPRVAAVEKDFRESPTINSLKSNPVREYIQLPPRYSPLDAINKVLLDNTNSGSVLLIVPDTRTAVQLHRLISNSILLDSQMERAERYRSYLAASQDAAAVIIGTRSSIFAPVANLERIFIVDEGSEHYYERRTPGWNVRDVAIIRSQLEKVSLTFLGYSPSSEVARLIETGWIKYRSRRDRIQVLNFQKISSELLPGRIFSEIRKGLSAGPILFLVPRKGFSQAISCSKCRNLALCSCGGKFIKSSSTASLQCVLCGKQDSDWHCTWCQGSTPFLIGRGSQRFAQEIGAAFPNIPIKISEGDQIIHHLDSFAGVVISTPGAIPEVSHGYSLVTILEGDSFFLQSDIRSQERARQIFFSCAAYLASDGKLLTVISDSHPILGALAAWKPSIVSQQELRERESVHLPPFSRALTMDAPTQDIQSIARGLESAKMQGRLPNSSSILGPLSLGESKSRIVVTCPIEDGEQLIGLIHEFQRRRSASKKVLSSLRIDPYSLTR